MLADPETSMIPDNIRQQEMNHAARILYHSNLRKAFSSDIIWTSSGPYNIGGRTRALAIDQKNEDVLLAGGVSGGMWRSDNQGTTWKKISHPSSLHSVSCIVQDTRPGKTNIWYYGTGEYTGNSASKKAAFFHGDGIFKSTDGGNSWEQQASTTMGVPNKLNSQFQYIWRILVNTENTDQDEIFVAAIGAIFRSVDGGETWGVVLGNDETNAVNEDLALKNISEYTDIIQTKDGVYYAVFSHTSVDYSLPGSEAEGVYRSIDGLSWTNILPSRWTANHARTIIATSDSNPDVIYFLVNGTYDFIWKYTYLSGDGSGSGGKWENLRENIPNFGGEVGNFDSQNSYNMVMKIHPEDNNIIFLGGTNLYRSSDGFTSTQHTDWIGGYDTSNNVKIYTDHFVDQHDVVFFPSNPDKMLSANDGGIYITINNRAKDVAWTPLNNGFVTSQFYTIALNETESSNMILGGLQDGGSLIANKPDYRSEWKRLLSGDGGQCMITRSNAYYYVSSQYGITYRLTVNDKLKITSFTRIDPAVDENTPYLFINPFILAPDNHNIMYFAGGQYLWRNDNLSQIPLYKNTTATLHWQQLQDSFIGRGSISALAAGYNQQGMIYYGSNTGRLFKITNAHLPEYDVSEITSPDFPVGAYVGCIAVDRDNDQHIVVVFSNYNVISLFASFDGGNTFNPVSGNLEEHPDGTGGGPSVRWLDIVSIADGTNKYFAGTSTGLYSTSVLAGTNTFWTQESMDKIGNVVVTMVRHCSDDGRMVVATHGSGTYETFLDNVARPEKPASEQLSFSPAYPNPFTTEVNIPFALPSDGIVRIRIFNINGQAVKTLLWAYQFAGSNVVSWDGTNENGVKVTSGTYICRLEHGNSSKGTKLVFLS